MRTTDIQRVAQLAQLNVGPVVEMSRGTLEWQITIPVDGRLGCDGIAPSVIQWKGEIHPASRLSDSNISLVRLEARHPQARKINDWLANAGFEGTLNLQAPADGTSIEFTALLQTPKGVVRFC
ncbi:MAG: VOC family protein [Planctomycetaceae bacterium]